jgi:alpha-ketoglutarate-dependent taurine dioxygenase
MHHELHENGWTIMLGDFDFANATQEDADQIGAWVSSNMAVVAQGANIERLTPELQVKFCQRLGHIEEFPLESAWGRAITLGTDDASKKIQRVTGALDENGHPGLFGHDEDLDWHNNTPWNPKRKPVVWLKSISGAEGSKTSWSNHRLAYEDMRREFPDFVQELEEQQYRVVPGWRGEHGHTSMYRYWSEFGEIPAEVRSEISAMPLIFTNESGHRGFFLPYLQIFGILGLNDTESKRILDRVWEYCQQDKYLYHHDWAPGGGEVVIAEQWLSVHKRYEFARMKSRFMHRIAVDYTNTGWFGQHQESFQRQIDQAMYDNQQYLETVPQP